MGKLQDPSRELAKRILTEVDFENRFNGFSLRERAGAVPITMYSFEEVVTLFNDRYPRLDFDQLEAWVRNIMGDKELASQIAEVVRDEQSNQEKSLRIRKLMEERLSQCKMLRDRS